MGTARPSTLATGQPKARAAAGLQVRTAPSGLKLNATRVAPAVTASSCSSARRSESTVRRSAVTSRTWAMAPTGRPSRPCRTLASPTTWRTPPVGSGTRNSRPMVDPRPSAAAVRRSAVGWAKVGATRSSTFISRAWLDRRSTSAAKAGLASSTRPVKSNSTMPTGAEVNAAVRQSAPAAPTRGTGTPAARSAAEATSASPRVWLACGGPVGTSAMGTSQVDRSVTAVEATGRSPSASCRGHPAQARVPTRRGPTRPVRVVRPCPSDRGGATVNCGRERDSPADRDAPRGVDLSVTVLRFWGTTTPASAEDPPALLTAWGNSSHARTPPPTQRVRPRRRARTSGEPPSPWW